MTKNLTLGAVVVGAMLLIYGVVSFTPVRTSPFDPVSGYVYKQPARVEIALGAGLVVAGLLLRRRER